MQSKILTWSPRARAFWPILATLLIADCTTKRLAETYLVPENVPHNVAGTVVRFTLTHNSGAAMNMSLGRYSRIAFSIAAAFAIVVLAQLYRTTPATDRLRALSLALLIGGATGNLVNRLTSSRGVIDFIDIGVPSWRFWTFNVADAGLTIGAVLLASVLWRERSQALGGT